MARYIDAEALTDHMLERYSKLWEKHGDYDHYTTGYGDAIDTIEDAPTADVVPKKEIANVLYDLKHKIHDKAVRPNNAGIDAYISLKVFDAVLQGYLNKLE